MLRLFDRGHREESVFVNHLRSSGVHVLDVDPNTGEQFRIAHWDGHFGGSLDALIFDPPDFPGVWGLGEFKTHNDKSFRDLVKNKVKKSKWEHYVQMNIYMYKYGLQYALYMAVNKNDDSYHFEVVELDAAVAEQYIDRAGKIIYAERIPDRISDDPGWYECKFCDYRLVCHNDTLPAKNCRTCVHSTPAPEGQWGCDLYGAIIPEGVTYKGCENYAPRLQ